MKNKKIVEELKGLNPEETAKLTLTFYKKSLNEINYVSGEWEGKTYYCEASTNWRSSELTTEEMTVEEVIGLLKKKNVSEMNQGDFNGLQLVEASDGSTDEIGRAHV